MAIPPTAAAPAAAATPRPRYGGAPLVLLTREAYEGPVLVGSIWRPRGTGGHAQSANETVTVEHLTTSGRVGFVRNYARRGKSGRRHHVDEPVFRVQYELVRQPPGARTNRAVAYAAALVNEREGRITPAVIEQYERETRVDDVAQEMRAPAAAAEEIASAAPAAAPAEEAPAAPTAPPEPEPEVDPLEAFLALGRGTLERLDAEVTRLGEDRELALLELQELDQKLEVARTRRGRVSRGIEAAIAAVTRADPPAPAPEPDLIPAAFVDEAVERAQAKARSLEARAIVEDAPSRRRKGRGTGTPRAQQLLGQVEWMAGVLAGMTPGQAFSNTDLVPGFRDRFGVEEREARNRINFALADWIKRSATRADLRPLLRRTGLGQYEVVAEAAALAEAGEEAPPPPPAPAPAEDAQDDEVDVVGADGADGADAPTTPSQRDWLRERFAERKLWPVRDLVPGFMEAFGVEREPARQNISSTISDWMKHQREGAPRLIRVSAGLYEAVS